MFTGPTSPPMHLMTLNYVRMSTAIHVKGLLNVGEVEGVEETGRDGANAWDEHAARIAGLGLHDMDSAGVKEELARTGIGNKGLDYVERGAGRAGGVKEGPEPGGGGKKNSVGPKNRAGTGTHR